MDLAGQTFALGQHAGGVLGGSQIGAGGSELLDQVPALFALQVQGLIPPHHRHRHGGAEGRTDRHRSAESALMGGEACDSGQSGGRHGGQCGAAGQQVELEKVQREGHPHPVGGQRQQHQPDGAYGAQPQGGGRPRAADAWQERAGRVDEAACRGRGDDPSGVRAVIGHGPAGGQGEQADDQQVQAPGQGSGGGGQCGGGGVHSPSTLRRNPLRGFHRKLQPVCRPSMRQVLSWARCPWRGLAATVGTYRFRP